RGADELVLNDPAVQPDDDVFRSLISFVAMVGLMLGELHVVLAAKTGDEAFSPVVSGDSEVEAMRKASPSLTRIWPRWKSPCVRVIRVWRELS
ncbi:hypothetical protein ACC685_36540, partial [Rhizobium ruizarguesonis]